MLKVLSINGLVSFFLLFILKKTTTNKPKTTTTINKQNKKQIALVFSETRTIAAFMEHLDVQPISNYCNHNQHGTFKFKMHSHTLKVDVLNLVSKLKTELVLQHLLAVLLYFDFFLSFCGIVLI